MFPNARNTNINNSNLTYAGRDHIHAARDVVINPQGLPITLHEKLGPVDDAGYNRWGQVSKCKPQTRVDLLSTITRWANEGSMPICWLNGPAGFGKSAVAQTMAEYFATQGQLAGSFFFLRGAGARSSISRLIPTLAYQLSVSSPAVKPYIEQVLRNEPTILQTSSFFYQFQHLIIEPILRTPRAAFAIIVLDALDECDDKELMAEFLAALIEIMSGLHACRLRILLTSRVEEHIRKKCDNPKAKAVMQQLELGHFDARPDIEVYFRDQFHDIYAEHYRVMRRTPRPWPSAPQMQVLLEKTGMSFMFAITLVQMIRSSDSPAQQLQVVLQAEGVGLDSLYYQVLASFNHTPTFQRILGTIMILPKNQSVTVLAHLLKLEAEDIICSLLAVQSIIIIPGDDDNQIQLYHTSLRDFLTTPSRSGIHYVNPPLQHIFLAIDCLQLLAYESTELFFNSGAEIYACLHWSHHMCLGLETAEQILTEDMCNSLIYFLSTVMFQSLKRWFNTVLLAKSTDRVEVLNHLDNGIKLLQKSKNYLSVLKCMKSASELALEVSINQYILFGLI